MPKFELRDGYYPMPHILVTGGAGFIGSHTCVELLDAGYDITVVDNLLNSSEQALARVEAISKRSLAFVKADIRDAAALQAVFADNTFDAVVHFAGLKAVGESVAEPLKYYDHNVHGSRTLLQCMLDNNVGKLVFSSSATVYGDPQTVPIDESAPLSAVNPYGQTKLIIENMIRELGAAQPGFSATLLRYFNPVGAHPSGMIGEDPQDIPNNLMPYIAQVAVGKLEKLRVFGSDYPTEDGTGVRDYIHVVDLARGHLAALKRLEAAPGVVAYNLGTGIGYSVLQMHAAFERASGREIPYELVARRGGDAAVCYADAALAQRELGWRAELDLDAMTRDAWRWQQNNPNGYRSSAGQA